MAGSCSNLDKQLHAAGGLNCHQLMKLKIAACTRVHARVRVIRTILVRMSINAAAQLIVHTASILVSRIRNNHPYKEKLTLSRVARIY